MRILCLGMGGIDHPGTRLRIWNHVPHLERRGHQVSVQAPLDSIFRSRFARRLVRPVDLARDVLLASHHDLVLVYRKTFPGRSAGWLRRRARRIVYDFDDAVWLPSPGEAQGPRVEARYRRNFENTIAIADLIVAGNRTLAAETRRRAVAVLPTPVDLELFRPQLRLPRAPEAFVVGWVGTADNLPEWEALGGAFRRIAARHPEVRFRVVANREPRVSDLPVEFERFSLAREAACLADWQVGLMPLADTPWNRGKCGAKALHAMAMGIPVVISPVGMNREVVEHGVNGFLATQEDEWVEALDRLIRDPALGERMGLAARRTVEERYASSVTGARLVELLEGLG